MSRSSPPSAPPYGSGTSAASGSSSSSGSPAADGGAAAPLDASLYADLLRRANGDQGLVQLWLAEMGFKWDPSMAAPTQRQQSEDGIKAVQAGAAGGGGGGAMGSAWNSLTAMQGSPMRLKTDPLRTAPAAGVSPSKADGDLDSRAAAAGAPRTFFCPISLQIMRDPVVISATGQTYDRPCIERWLAQGNRSCPATGQALSDPVQLVPNVALRSSIEEWAEKHAPWLLGRDRRVKPVPKEDQFAAMPAAGAVTDPDLQLAIQLQQEELGRLASQRQRGSAGAAGGTPLLPGARSSFNVAGPPNGMRSVPGGGSQQQLGYGGSGYPPPGAGPAAAAGQPAGRRSRFNLTTAVLLATTAAWIALFIVSLAENGWNLGDLSLNPFAGPDQAALLAVGAQEASLVTSAGQWWRLFSSPFVNAGVIQLLLNMSVLWTLGRHLEAALHRQLPALSLTAIFLIGSWVGALTSANLNSYYVSCGASAGVCALLGATWADQLLWHKRYVNHGWTCLVLFLISAVFIVMSLLPLVDPWYQGAALLTGFVVAPVPLLARRARRGRPNARRWLVLQCACAVLVIGAATAGVVGIVTKSEVGSTTSFLQDGSCLTFGHWQCLPAGSSPNGCNLEVQGGGAPDLLRCPLGVVAALPEGTTVVPGDTKLITQLCFQYCSLSGGGSGDGGDGGGSSPGGWGGGAAAPSPPAAAAGGGGTNGTSPGAGSGGGGGGCGNETTPGAPVLC